MIIGGGEGYGAGARGGDGVLEVFRGLELAVVSKWVVVHHRYCHGHNQIANHLYCSVEMTTEMLLTTE